MSHARHILRLLSGIALLVCAAGAAEAQATGQRSNEQVRENARFHFGPVYFTPRLRVDGIGVDSNVRNAAENAEEGDFSFVVTPQVVSWVPFGRRALVTTTISSGYTYYRTFARERSSSGAIDVRGDLFLGRITLFAGGGLSSSKERPSYEIDERFRNAGDNSFGGIDVRLSSRTSFDVSAFGSHLEFADDAIHLGVALRETFNRTERGYRGSVTQRLTSMTSVGVQVEHRQLRFVLAKDRDASSLMIAPTITLSAKALISGTAKVGFKRFKPVSLNLQDYVGVVAALSTGYQFRSATRFDVEWNRDLGHSYDPLQPYYVFNETGLRVRRQLVGRFDTIAGLRRTTYDYRTFEGVPVEDVRHVRLNALTLDVGYRLTRESRVGIGVTRWSRPEEPPLRGYETYRVGLTFNYGY